MRYGKTEYGKKPSVWRVFSITLIILASLVLSVALLTGSHATERSIDRDAMAQSQKLSEEELLPFFDSLSRLAANADRSIDEYDTSDESADTLLWSREKTGREIARMLSEELERRDLLYATPSLNHLAYEARVRRWNFRIPEGVTAYRAILQVTEQLSSRFDEVDSLLTEELDKALSAGYYDDALYLLEWRTNKEGENLFADYIDRFAGQPQQVLVQLLDLQQRYRETLDPLREAGDTEGWLREEAQLHEEYLSLKSHFEGNRYGERLRSIANELFGYAPAITDVTYTDIRAGEVIVHIEGPTRRPLVLYLDSDEGSRREQRIRAGRATEVTSYAVLEGDARWISDEVRVRLPRVGYHTFVLFHDEAGMVATNMTTWEKIAVRMDDRTVYALDRQDGTPISDVEVKVYKGDSRRRAIATLRTDRDGRAVIRQTPPSGGYFFISVQDPRLAHERTFAIYGEDTAKRPDVKPERKPELHYYTDRPIYRPGQTIHVGLVSVIREGEKVEAEPNTIVKVSLKAERSGVTETIDTQSITTNDKGVAEAAFVLPKDEELTDFTLESESGSIDLQVEAYKLMHLTLTIDSIPTGYVCGQPMRIYGRTEDMNGHPVEAELTLQYDLDGKRMTGRSGVDGRFMLETAPLSEARFRGYYFNHPLTLSAVDALGDLADQTLPMLKDTTNLPLSADAALGGLTALNRHELTITTATQPYQHHLLGDLSRYHLTASFINKEGKVAGEAIDLPMKGEKALDLSDLKSGSYRLRLTTTDYWGKEVTSESHQVYLYSPDDTQLYGEVPLFVATYEDEILYGSSFGGALSAVTRDEKGKEHHSFLPIESGKIYRMKSYRDASSILFSAFHIGQEYSRSLDLSELRDDATSESEAHTSGLFAEGEEESFNPGTEMYRTFTVMDKEGKPMANAPVLVTVFDKSLLDAAGEKEYWSKIGEMTYDYSDLIELRSLNRYGMVLAENAVNMPVMAAKQEVALDASSGGGDLAAQPIVRRDFRETAFYDALLQTDDEGKVSLRFTLPDTQTRYVLKVYSFTPDFKSELLEDHYFSVFAPLSVELSLPRYLRYGDRLDGLARVQNAGDTDRLVTAGVTSGEKDLGRDSLSIPAGQTMTLPFTVEAQRSHGDSLALDALAESEGDRDELVRSILLRSDLTHYTVAVPFSAWQKDEVTLTLPKSDLSDQQGIVEIYFSPIHLLLTTLADDYATRTAPERLSLLEASTQYAVYNELHHFIQSQPELRRSLSLSHTQLRAATRDRESEPRDSFRRQADPRTLADFYDFLLSEEQMSDLLGLLERRIIAFAFPDGGFRYDPLLPEASPWLTHVVLESLSYAPDHSDRLAGVIDRSLDYLEKELAKDHGTYYSSPMEYRLLADKLGRKEINLTGERKEQLRKEVTLARKSYQTASTSQLLHFADYSRRFDSESDFAPIRQFISDRTEYAQSDRELLQLILFLEQDKPADEPFSPEVTRFMLQLKQGTLWSNPLTLAAIEPLLTTVKPTSFAKDAVIRVGELAYHPDAIDKATGHVLLAIPALAARTPISWSGIATDFAFGGLRYGVTERAADATPTGERLTVAKEVYARRIIDGESTLVRLTDERAAVAGEKLLVRYLVETQQDLSLVTLQDDRAAAAEPGYDFWGYGSSDRTFYAYRRGETSDRLFIDYLPKGKHVFEMESTASVAGHFTYGPTEVQSYYAPEYAGNSAGGSLDVTRK